jgi:uncharacterized membrane protein
MPLRSPLSQLAALALFLPVWLYQDFARLASAPNDVNWAMLVVSGLGLSAQELPGYVYLREVDATTHAVTNGIRSVVVIVAASFYFDKTLGASNLGGIVLTVTGVVAYSLARRKAGGGEVQKKRKKAKDA